MNKVRILFVEDSPEDLILFVRLFKKSGLDFTYEHVDSLEALTSVLQRDWDIVISDFHLSRFTAAEVVQFLAKERPEMPVIVVSGAISEEEAVDLMRLGARDFVRKDNYARLVPAIMREVREGEQRQAKHKAESELASSLELNHRVLESMEDAVLILDFQGGITSLNTNAVRGFRFPQERWQGVAFADLWPRAEDRENALASVQKASQASVGKFVGWHPVGDSEGRWWHTVVTPLSNPQKSTERILVIARDVTEDRRIQEELKHALMQAESANRMKTAFLANMSHEIRTPVGAMMGFSELFMDPSTTEEERKEYLEIIRRNGETLLKLLNEILDLSKIEAGHLEIESLNFSPTEIVNDVMTSLKLAAEHKGLNLFVDPSVNVPTEIRSDPTRLKQILLNLVGNAIKFTERGTVRIQMTSPSPSSLCFLIKDTGIGIPPEEQGALFKVFSQGDNSLTRRFGGTGLGLALSKRLARALGGDVVILKSEPGIGSEFLLTVSTCVVAHRVEFRESVTV